MTKKQINKFASLLKTHSQPAAMIELLTAGVEFTADEAKSVGVADPNRVVNTLREYGFPVYLNNRKTPKGETVRRYRLGTPRKA